MKRVIGGLLTVAFLASCGADGMPSKPTKATPSEAKFETTGPVDMMAAES
jgi:hypothetical protein